MRVISKFAHSAAINANLSALVDSKRSTRQLFPRRPGPCPARRPGGAAATARSAPPRSTRTHRANTLSTTDSSAATSATVLPVSITRWAASVLNSSVNFRLVAPISDILPAGRRPACRVSTKSGESHLDHAVRVADPFHVVRIANRCVDKVRRRVQNETLGHRGRKVDPLYRIRKLLLSGYERLDESAHERVLLGLRHGDPHDELLGAWLAKESVRDIYLTEDPKDARVLLDKAIVGCKNDEVEEIRSLGDTLERWRTEILNHHRTGASNGPTEGL